MRITLNYRAGGLLIATRDGLGVLHVLLGKRLNDPGAKTWSFPGGKCDHLPRKGGKIQILRYTESCRVAARREAEEEIKLWPQAPVWLEAGALSHLCGLRTFFYDWSTYGWLVENPGLQPATFPGTHPHEEFFELRWFPFDALPRPLHFGVKAAVNSARRRWKAVRQGGMIL